MTRRDKRSNHWDNCVQSSQMTAAKLIAGRLCIALSAAGPLVLTSRRIWLSSRSIRKTMSVRTKSNYRVSRYRVAVSSANAAYDVTNHDVLGLLSPGCDSIAQARLWNWIGMHRSYHREVSRALTIASEPRNHRRRVEGESNNPVPSYLQLMAMRREG